MTVVIIWFSLVAAFLLVLGIKAYRIGRDYKRVHDKFLTDMDALKEGVHDRQT